MTRHQRILAVVLVAQLALILLVRSPLARHESASEQRAALFGELAEFDATRIELSDGDGSKLELARGDEGWSILGDAAFPADEEKIGDLIEQLSELRARRPVVSSARYHAKFEVTDDAPAGRIRIWGTADDAPAIDLLLGSSPTFQVTHARRGDDDAVFEIVGLQPYDVRPQASAWIDKQLVDVSLDRVDALRIERPAGRLELRRDGEDWVLLTADDAQPLPIDPLLAGELIAEAAAIRLSDTAGPRTAAHGLEQPAARVTIEYRDADGEPQPPLVVLLGDPVEEQQGKRYVGREGFAYTGIVWDSSLSRIFEADAEALALPADAIETLEEFEETPFG